ncbi:hypothetical protein [Neosynechococcus sphagnicola]|uniref:hypothetical protein n=1 Tax=Neosynechococcus sphagnicola TaxID=1501145 RepID=UPI00068EA2AA|nr:hypothetical protein [Neosynechococcus sphagnicola]
MVDSLIITASKDPFTRGLDYLYGVRSLALDPEMVKQVHDLEHRSPICIWISEHIEAVNTYLQACLQACQNCFDPWEQPTLQIFATPLAQSFGVDGLCNLQTQPISILIDVGRVMPQDWLRVVVHEYAHAHAGSPGHHQQFAQSLGHLCLGLEIAPPFYQPGMEDSLRYYPSYLPTQDPLAFWRGEGEDWRSMITNSYFPPQFIS